MVLTVRQRLGIFSLAGTIQGKLEDLAIWEDIQNKLEVTDELRESAFHLVSGGAIEDKEVLDSGEVLEVSLEKEENRRLKTLLSSFEGFRAVDRRWVVPVLAQLETT